MTETEPRRRGAGRHTPRGLRALRVIAAFLAVALLAFAAACGDSDDEPTTQASPPAPPTSPAPPTAPTPPPTGNADQYRQQADAICGQQNSQIEALGEPTNSEELAQYLNAAIPIAENSLQQFTALQPPPELASGHAEALQLLTQQLTLFRQVQAQIQAGTDAQQAFQAVSGQLEQLDQQLDAKARELGLTVCGQDDSGDSPAPPPSPTPPSDDPSGGDAQFQTDSQELGSALTDLGTALQAGAGDPLSIDRGALESSKQRIGSAIQSMGGYTLSDTAQDVKRQAIVSAGPGITAAIDGIIQALDSGNATAVQASAIALASALAPIQQAIGG